MGSSRRRLLIGIAVAALVGLGAGLVIGLTEDDPEPEPSAVTDTTAPEPPASSPPAEDEGDDGRAPADDERLPPPEEDPQGATPGPSGPAPETTDEQAAAGAARAYIAALTRRDGAAVCRRFAPGALSGVDFPEPRSACPATVRASLGFRDPRGRPVWESSAMTDAVSAQVDGDSARVVATVFTEYRDIREPTIEDDIIYLTRRGEQWLIAKASATLYRAIGDTDVPPSVLAPP